MTITFIFNKNDRKSLFCECVEQALSEKITFLGLKAGSTVVFGLLLLVTWVILATTSKKYQQ